MIKGLSKNWLIKIFCLLIAAGLWFYVTASQNTVAKLPGAVQIKALNIPAGLIAVYDVKTVDLKIMAEPSDWKKLNSDSFSAFVDLASLSEGTYQLDIKVTSTIPNVQVVEKSPDKIFVSLEKLTTKEINVNKRVEGQAATGLVAGNINLTPDKVVARGPKSIIDSLSEATALIKLNGESANFKKNVELFAFDEEGNAIDNIEFTPSEVEASVDLIKAANTKTVGVKVVTEGQLQSGYYIENIKVVPDTIDILGPKQYLDKINFVETAPINIASLNSNLSKEVMLKLSDGIAVDGASPTKVSVEISVAQYDTTKETYFQIKVINLTAGYSLVSAQPDLIKAVLSGPKSKLDGLRADDLIVTLDFGSKRLTQSNETLLIDIKSDNFRIPTGTTLINFSPSTISINLQKKP